MGAARYHPGGYHEAKKRSPGCVKVVGDSKEASTPWAGASLLVGLFRRSGVDAVANKVLPPKGSAKGLKQGQTVESFVLLIAMGGECIEDIKR